MSPSGMSDSLSALLDYGVGPSGKSNVFSLNLATVENIKDDQNLNRVKCLPIGARPEEMTDWCYVMSPMGGKNRGLFLFPQVGDLVVLGYLENDVHRPIVLGSYWNSVTTAPMTVKDGKAEDYCLVTPHNVSVSAHDEDKKQKLTIKMPSGIVVEIDDEKETVTTQNSGGDTSLVMKMKDGEIVLKAKSKLTLSVGNASVELDDKANITIKGTGDITLDGKTVAVEANGNAKFEGTNVSVSAKADLKVSAVGTASVKGSLLKLN